MTEKIVATKAVGSMKRGDIAAKIVLSKELKHEEFGDGIMSSIDFRMDLKREPNPSGDRLNIVISGNFLPARIF